MCIWPWIEERTLAEAQALHARFPQPGQRPSLFGVPVAIKDCFDVAGYPTTCGSRFYAEKNGIARADSTRGCAAAPGRRRDHGQDPSASAGLRHHRREQRLRRLRSAARSTATHRRLVQRERRQRAGGLGSGRHRHRYRGFHPRAGGALRAGRLSLHPRPRRRPNMGRRGASRGLV